MVLIQSKTAAPNVMKFKISFLAASVLVSIGSAHAVMIAGYDFQTTTTGGTAAAAAPGAPLVYNANFGTATLYLNGANGSSTFTSLASNPQVTSFGGSNVNTVGTGFSTVTTGASSLALANSSANGFRAVFVFSMTDLEDLAISYSTQASASGFNSQAWSYSTDGVNFTTFTTFNPRPLGPATTFNTVGVVNLDTTALSVLDDAATVYVGLTVNGATANSGNNRIDNIQFNAVPEPAATLLGAVGLLGIMRRRR